MLTQMALLSGSVPAIHNRGYRSVININALDTNDPILLSGPCRAFIALTMMQRSLQYWKVLNNFETTKLSYRLKPDL